MSKKNPTERVRAMLDELGVEYHECKVNECVSFDFDYCPQCDDYRKEIIVAGAYIEVAQKYLTPEESIAAMVGAGTCRNIAEMNRDGVSGYFFVCSECGLAVHAGFDIRETNYPHKKPDGSTDLRTFNSNGKYEFERCPRCGRKVTE